MKTNKQVSLQDDPEVVAFQLFKRSNSGKSNLASALKLGKLGQSESYNAQSINEGLANRDLVGFMNLTDKGGVMVVRKSTPLEATEDSAPTA